ncbi:PepSY-associated TM helix domain-containing protein [Pseudoalteromonas ruthenica]|uniref:PepSY-associated TM helix domain-containing protein n=1 Tax=Pseudoalteromonas ruthenica TaxID=151081 RepID=UPI001247108C|nr:PepSY-associated TM helix domain-containing protein [Pseudoalteromonas ruthenica]
MKVRSDILRTYQGVHKWTGIIAGLVLFIGFYAGSLTMFKHEIQRWAAPVTAPKVTSSDYDYQKLVDTVISVRGEQLAKGFNLDLHTQDAPLSWYIRGSARGMELDKQLNYAHLNADGTLNVSTQTENELGDLIDYLHRTAGFIGEIGHDQSGVYILGIASVLYFLALVSGVIILLPTLVKTFFALRKEKGPSRFWLDSHNLVGIASLPFHLVIAFTVVVFAFHDFIYGGLAQFYDDKPLFQRPTPAAQSFHTKNLPSIDEQVLAAKSYAPGYEPIHIRYSNLNSASPSAVFMMSNNNAVVRGPDTDYLFMNPYTLEVVNSSYPQGEGAVWGNMVASIFSLHFGTYGGEWGRWGYFIMGLLGAFLFYSGNLLWIDKRFKKDPNKRSTLFMAKLTIGVCLGSMIAVAFTLVAAKWLATFVVNANYASLYSYYAAFFAFVMYSILKPVQKATTVGLYLLASLCALMVLSTLMKLALSDGNALFYSSYMVDIVAAMFAVTFFKMSKHQQQKQATQSIMPTFDQVSQT